MQCIIIVKKKKIIIWQSSDNQLALWKTTCQVADNELCKNNVNPNAQTSFSEELADSRTSCASKNSVRESAIDSLLSLEIWWTRPLLSSLEFSCLKEIQSFEKKNATNTIHACKSSHVT